MKDIIEALDENLVYKDHQIIDDYIVIIVESSREELQCPYCGEESDRIHSTYERSFQDLPIQGKKVYINVTNRKFFCDNESCSYTTFAETFDCLKPKAKKSERLKAEIMRVSVEVSSIVASNILKYGIVNVSKSTICEMLKKNNKNVRPGKRR